MQRPFGFRSLLLLCSALAILLAALAAVQYRWSTRVAAADLQREHEHLDASVSLFTNSFEDAIFQTVDYIQKEAREAVAAGRPAAAPPRIVSQLFYVDLPEKGAPSAKRLTPQGEFVPAEVPAWFQPAHCNAVTLDRPPAVVFPVFEIRTVDKSASATLQILRSARGGRCFVALLDEPYLKTELFPKLIQKSFGETSVKDYDFAVVERAHPETQLYGPKVQPDISKPFFTMSMRVSGPPAPPSPPSTSSWKPSKALTGVFVQRFEYNVMTARHPANFLFRDGIWELQVAHKGVPLAEAFEQTRRRNMFFSLVVEGLLIAAIVFLVVGVRRVQRLADQKMQFVAAVSHELRAPLSAISMLSRNQADGLVTGGDKVQQYGELMHQQSRRLNEMVEQTLQYAGIHSNLGRAAKTEIDLKRLIHEAVEARRSDLDRAGFQVEIEVAANLPPIYGDANLLRIAIDNLLSNAEKYSNGSRWIGVNAKHAAAEREVQITVEDRGTGIDAADQSEVFEPFYRGHAAIDAQIPGSGIGLSLVRSAAEAHRGTVTLVSEPGRGSTFTLHLPL